MLSFYSVKFTGGTPFAGHDFRHITPEILLCIHYNTKIGFRQWFFRESANFFCKFYENMANYIQKFNFAPIIQTVYSHRLMCS